MKRSIELVFMVVMLILALVGCSTNNTELDNNENNVVTNNDQDTLIGNSEDDEENVSSDKKILVAYFSAQNHTEAVANKIAELLDADIFEMIPEDEYTEADLDWTNSNSRVTNEHNDESLRDVKLVNTSVENWEEYDTVLIGYPIWWGIAAWPTNDFVANNDFTGKTVIPFCTSSSSGLGESGTLLEEIAGTGDWQEGHRFSSSASDSTIEEWVNSLNLSIM